VQVISKAGKKDFAQAQAALRAPGIKVASYDMAAKLLAGCTPQIKFDTVICDEVHFLKDPRTKRFKGLHAAIKGAARVYLLSGTPAPNRNKELFPVLSLLYPSYFTDYYMYARRYCAGTTDVHGRFDDRGASNVRELTYLLKKFLIRMRREDHLEDLPAQTRESLYVQPEKIPPRFLELKRSFVEELSRMDVDEQAMFRAQSLASQLFVETSKIKIPPVLEYLTAYVEETDEKTILFCKHQNMISAVCAHLDELRATYITISGATPMEVRPELVQRFLSSAGPQYAVLSIGACATGLNFIPVRKMIFLELSWSPSDMTQCEARINRIGGASHLEYIYVLCEKTVDEMVFKKLLSKNDLTNQIIDDGQQYGDFEFVPKRARTS
jgi:SNF2 family DNA or RNA helicase